MGHLSDFRGSPMAGSQLLSELMGETIMIHSMRVHQGGRGPFAILMVSLGEVILQPAPYRTSSSAIIGRIQEALERGAEFPLEAELYKATSKSSGRLYDAIR